MHINGRAVRLANSWTWLLQVHGVISVFEATFLCRSPHAGIIKLECGHLTVSDESQESIHVYTPVGYTVSLFRLVTSRPLGERSEPFFADRGRRSRERSLGATLIGPIYSPVYIVVLRSCLAIIQTRCWSPIGIALPTGNHYQANKKKQLR